MRREDAAMDNENQTDVRVVRPVDRSLLGPGQENLVPLPITDDRDKNPFYRAAGEILEACDRPE
jgi:hypothetical protein